MGINRTRWREHLMLELPTSRCTFLTSKEAMQLGPHFPEIGKALDKAVLLGRGKGALMLGQQASSSRPVQQVRGSSPVVAALRVHPAK